MGALCAGMLATACTDPATEELVPREHRFGIFRDLVLFERPPSEGGPFFLDRFESTIAGFANWRGEVPARNPDLRPQGRVDLHDARRFAWWRFCRVPRADEWHYAATQGGAYIFPWGDTFEGTEANTGRLGLGETTPVGAFGSQGRQAGPFDLVGNVSEWTETVVDEATGLPLPYSRQVTRDVLIDSVVGLPEWPSFADPVEGEVYPYEQTGAMPLGLRVWLPLWAPMPEAWLRPEPASPVAEFEFQEQRRARKTTETLDMPGIDALEQTPGLNCWLPAGSPAPTDWLVAGISDQLERLVVGGHYRSLVRDKRQLPQNRSWQPRRHDPATGVRLACDPAGLLRALLVYSGPLPSQPAQNTLRRFLRQPDHSAVLRAAWPQVLRTTDANGVLRALLVAELGPG